MVPFLISSIEDASLRIEMGNRNLIASKVKISYLDNPESEDYHLRSSSLEYQPNSQGDN